MPQEQLIIQTRRASRGGGFTLPEMIVVMAITAILAATAAPSLLSLGTTRSAAAARQLVRDLSYARQRAIATGTTHWVVFNTTAQNWSVLVESTTSPGRVGAAALNDLATGRSFVQSLNAGEYIGVQITAASIGGGSEVGFDWRGKPFNASSAALTANGTVTLTGSRTVTINGNTGYATTP